MLGGKSFHGGFIGQKSMHKYHPAEGIIHVGRVPFLIKIILFASSLLLLLPSSIIKKKESLNRYRSKRGCDPLPRFSRCYPWKLSFIRSVDGVERGIARSREITTLRKKRQAFRARRNCFYAGLAWQTSLLARTSIWGTTTPRNQRVVSMFAL